MLSSHFKDSTYSILVVDDEPVSRTLLERILRKKGFNVITAENGEEALNLFKNQYIPIILTDWMMPKMNGLELCRAIRQIESPGYVFIIIITAKDSRDDIVKGLEAGADDYVNKPFYPPELLARIKTGIRILELEKSLREANEEIKRLSITDPLTGCYNRGYLMKHLSKEVKRAVRYSHPLSIAMTDIDHFKNVNDTYGHQAGDIVLKRFVELIRSSIRDGIDWVARYGGEEFVIVIPETGLEDAKKVIERLRKRIEATEIDIGNDKKIKITASFGVVCFDPRIKKEMVDIDSIIKEADKLLYEAKNKGRNMVKAGLLA